MDLNSLVVGEGVILSMGYPLTTRKGKLLHPLIRTVDVLSRHKALGSVLVLVAALGLGYASSDSLRASITLPASIAALVRPVQAPPVQVAVAVENPQATTPAVRLQATPIPEIPEGNALVPAAVLAAATPASGGPGVQAAAVGLPGLPGMPSPYAVPANAVIVPPPAQVDVGTGVARASLPAPQKPQKPDEKAASPITVLDLTAGESKREQGAKADQPATTLAKPEVVPEVAKVSAPAQDKPLVETSPAAHVKQSGPPAVQLPKMIDVPKAKPEPTRQTQAAPAVRREPTPKAVPVQPRPPEQREQREQPKARRLSDTSDEGFARPIRERQVGGSSTQDGPAQTQRVEVLDITRNAIIVTNPRTKLPVMVGVGDRLPNGAVLTSVNPAGGTANTSAGLLRMD